MFVRHDKGCADSGRDTWNMFVRHDKGCADSGRDTWNMFVQHDKGCADSERDTWNMSVRHDKGCADSAAVRRSQQGLLHLIDSSAANHQGTLTMKANASRPGNRQSVTS